MLLLTKSLTRMAHSWNVRVLWLKSDAHWPWNRMMACYDLVWSWRGTLLSIPFLRAIQKGRARQVLPNTFTPSVTPVQFQEHCVCPLGKWCLHLEVILLWCQHHVRKVGFPIILNTEWNEFCKGLHLDLRWDSWGASEVLLTERREKKVVPLSRVVSHVLSLFWIGPGVAVSLALSQYHFYLSLAKIQNF
jgi:hypothetical protein